MGRKRRRKGQSTKEPEYDSDDPTTYKSMPAPDPESSQYYNDAVDDFNSKRDKISLEGGMEPAESSSDNQEEVLGLDDSDLDDLEEKMRMMKRNKHLEEMASDLDEEGEEGEDDEMPDAKAWGQKKKDFFDTDYVDDDLPGMSGSEEEAAREEEEREALAIQQRMAQTLDDGDFGLDLFKAKPIQKVQEKLVEEEEEEKVTLDLSKLSKREKLQILKKESPEFLELVEDFKVKMREVIDRLQPLNDMVKDARIPSGPGALYIRTKYNLCLGYCINISFYMVLKARCTPIHNHPIIGRILEYRKLLSELEPIDVKFADELQKLLDTKGKEDEENTSKMQTTDDKSSRDADTKVKTTKRKVLSTTEYDQGGSNDASEEPKQAKKAKRKKKSKTDSAGQSTLTDEEQKALQYYEAMAKKLQSRRDDKDKQLREMQGDDEDEGEDGGPGMEDETNDKRAISYKISKNKGLTSRKRKELRTPRVKNRMKYRKAKVRRKGQVREARTEMQRYGGEISGIRSGVIKSIKIK